MDKALKKMLQNTVVVSHQQGLKNSAGECEYDVPISYKCKVEYRETTYRDSSGKERSGKTRIFFDHDAVVALEDLVVLPTGEERVVINSLIKYDEKGNIDHLVVFA